MRDRRARTLAGHVETLASTKSIGYSASMSCPERCSSHGIASRFDGCENFLVGRSNGAGSRYLEVFFRADRIHQRSIRGKKTTDRLVRFTVARDLIPGGSPWFFSHSALRNRHLPRQPRQDIMP